MTVRFVEEARLEFLDSVSHYQRIGPELGRRFKLEVDQSIDRAVARPDLYPLRRNGYRRVNLHISHTTSLTPCALTCSGSFAFHTGAENPNTGLKAE